MEPKIHGYRYKIVHSGPSKWLIVSAPMGTYELCWFGGNEWRWHRPVDGFVSYPFESRSEAEEKAVELSVGKPAMTPEERKARLIACGWED